MTKESVLKYLDFLVERGISVSKIGINAFVLDYNSALEAIDILEEGEIPVLGGDVFIEKDGSPESTYDSWDCNEDDYVDFQDYLNDSIKRSREFIRLYDDKSEKYYFSIVTGHENMFWKYEINLKDLTLSDGEIIKYSFVNNTVKLWFKDYSDSNFLIIFHNVSKLDEFGSVEYDGLDFKIKEFNNENVIEFYDNHEKSVALRIAFESSEVITLDSEFNNSSLIQQRINKIIE